MGFLRNIDDSAASDEELVGAYQRTGDTRILATLYQRYIDLAYGVCLKYLKDPDAAQDAVMNVFEELIGKLARHPVGFFRGWLFVVVRNHCLMELRRLGRTKMAAIDPELVQSDPVWHPEEAMQNELRLERLRACVAALSGEQRKIVELFYFERKSYREITGLTGEGHDRIRSLIQNGRRNLRLCLERKEKESDG